jgi:hypothetical protein
MKPMLRKLFFVALTVAIASIAANSAVASTIKGAPGDNKPSVDYQGGTWKIVTDGQSVGLFDIQSASGIFTGAANLPSGALFSENSATRKSWSALPTSAFTADFTLGNISAANLTENFLLNDLTITYSGGFGTPNVTGDLTTIPEPMTITLLGLAVAGMFGFRRSR